MRWVVLGALAACGYSPVRSDLGPAPGVDAPGEPDAAVIPVDAPLPPDAPVLPACATDPAYVPSPAGIRYFMSSTMLSWNSAQADCASKGAHLAVIDDATENAHVAGLSTTHFWIGATDQTTEGVWVWVTGGAVAGFTAWRSGQPNDDGGQDCGEMDAGASTWNDFTCGDQTLYACECPP